MSREYEDTHRTTMSEVALTGLSNQRNDLRLEIDHYEELGRDAEAEAARTQLQEVQRKQDELQKQIEAEQEYELEL